MKGYLTILMLTACLFNRPAPAQAQYKQVQFEFCGQNFSFAINQDAGNFAGPLTIESITSFYQNVLAGNYLDVIASLKNYRQKNNPDDWLYYQLIRRTAGNLSPKKDNYFRYTLYKWYLLTSSGFDAILSVSPGKMLFYIQSDENIYNIPNRMYNGKQYVCLNYHDYGTIDFTKEHFTVVPLPSTGGRTFTYKVTHIPDFKATEYLEKDLHFSYNENDYHFKVKLTPQIQNLFTNYPVVDYESYLNIPLSKETYNSLIPQLKKNIKGMSKKNGVDYLMRFTRYAFLFEPDAEHFGGEKRLSPEQTLFYDQSDCEDRVALFFYLVKEIYNLPMIIMEYPNHVSVAVKFDKAYGKTVKYNGVEYSVCEPTPQKEDLVIGQLLPGLQNASFTVPFAYTPTK